MRYITVAILLFFIFACQAFSGQFNVGIAGVNLDGYVIAAKDNTVRYNYSRVLNKDPIYNVVVEEKNERGEEEVIVLNPMTAKSIAVEAEPYLMLHERGRKVSETIKINDIISVKIDGGEQFSILITDSTNEKRVLLHDGNAEKFVHNMKDADHISQYWFYSYFNNAFVEKQKKDSLSQNPIDQKDGEGFLDLAEMNKDYSENEIAANQKYDSYKGKTIKIRGTVNRISQNPLTNKPMIFLKESVKFIPITCSPSDDTLIDEIASLQPNQQIVVEGTWTGKPELFDATIIDARIVK